jgi:uncharacterized protein (TIGR04255 family)
MARIRHLKSAPITEALFDFRTRLPATIKNDDLKAAVQKIAGGYPRVKDAWQIEGSFEFSKESENAVASTSRRENGVHARSADEKQVAQFRLDGFTFNRLAPYTSWEEIQPEAFRLWQLYCDLVRPDALYRVAVRYINHIQLPDTPVELDDLLVASPRIPDELPQVFGSFLTTVVVPFPASKVQVRITQALNSPPAATPNTLLLDVDVSRSEETDMSTESLGEVFAELRRLKNEAFFGSVTEAMIARFE